VSSVNHEKSAKQCHMILENARQKSLRNWRGNPILGRSGVRSSLPIRN